MLVILGLGGVGESSYTGRERIAIRGERGWLYGEREDAAC